MATAAGAPGWLLRLLHRAYVARARRLHPLRVVFWEATRACNLACRHCGSSCRPGRPDGELSTAEVLAAFRGIAAAFPAREILVAITGGEPLVRPDLLAVMAELSGLGFTIGMVSNGWLLDGAAAAALVERGLRTISVSIDGREATHDRMRRPGSFRRALRALDAMGSFADVASEALTCVTRDALDELVPLGDELFDRGVRRWRLETVIPIGRAASDPALMLSGAELARLLDFIVAQRARGRNVSFGCESWLGAAHELQVRDHFFSCRAGVTIASILANGDISACPDLDRSFVQGNVLRDDFAQVWDQGFGRFRERGWMRRSLCTGCEAWADCTGGAMHMWTAGGEKLGCVYRTLRSAESAAASSRPASGA